jgi:hypothetical protein
MASQRAKVQAIEQARAELLPGYVEALRPSLLARVGKLPACVLGRQLRQVLAGVRYVADKYDAQRPGNEVVRNPKALLMGVGGDCEDSNVFLGGAVFRVCAPETPLASVYFPNVGKARHVALGYWDGTRWMVFDAVGETITYEYKGRGELIPW